jgi:hypothetical protein
LTELIGAADLYVTPYLDAAQRTSGTLAYAFGAGRAVISTPHWHATELLREQRGVLVPFADPTAIAREVSGLLPDGTRRNVMSKNAYRLGRKMVWSNTAGLYMDSFKAAQRQGGQAARETVAADKSGGRPYESRAVNPDHPDPAGANRPQAKCRLSESAAGRHSSWLSALTNRCGPTMPQT